ncbi:Non-specific serine/threonine protein kinase [Bertholletia excelsa]
MSLTNASMLVQMELSDNFFTGTMPMNLGDLRQLKYLNLAFNQLTNEPGKLELGFMNSMVECRMLQYIVLAGNPLDGVLPESVGNLSSSVENFIAHCAHIQGQIPHGIGNVSGMLTLILVGNNLTGNISPEIGQLTQLQRLILQENKLQGSIPKELCNLVNAGEIMLPKNDLSGSIPSCIGNLSKLQRIFLSSNKLKSTVPSAFWVLKGLLEMNFSQNSLEGEVPPEIGNLKAVYIIDLSGNKISSQIPSTVGELNMLKYLSLSNNSFQGPIFSSFSNLLSLEFQDLSLNSLSGSIPTSLETLLCPKCISISFNHLQGEIHSGGVFSNSSAMSFIGNRDLCGLPKFKVPICASNNQKGSRDNKLLLKLIIPLISSATLLAALVIWWIKQGKETATMPADLPPTFMHPVISYHELERATNNFNASNLLGVGSYGSVKLLNLMHEKAFKSFDIECELMRRIRHRNLVKVITTCSNEELRVIVLQCMPRGSLETWLHKEDHFLTLLQRINIMLDVAMAVDYLHHGVDEPVVHCDLKPSYVLLNKNMVAHVGDFGISKILANNGLTTQTETLGTIGYVAPGKVLWSIYHSSDLVFCLFFPFYLDSCWTISKCSFNLVG